MLFDWCGRNVLGWWRFYLEEIRVNKKKVNDFFEICENGEYFVNILFWLV